jgi:hypothetical protein
MAGVNHTSASMGAADSVSGRKRNVTIAGMDSSPGSIDDGEDIGDDKRRQPVKRACNECRQQKVRAVARPYATQLGGAVCLGPVAQTMHVAKPG